MQAPVYLDPKIDIFSYFRLIFEHSERRFVISKEFWSGMCKLDFFLAQKLKIGEFRFFEYFLKFRNFSVFLLKTDRIQKEEYFFELKFFTDHKSVLRISPCGKIFTDDESGLRIFKNECRT